MSRPMWDTCGRPTSSPLPGPNVAAFYLFGGSAACPSSAADLARVRAMPQTGWLLPIGVVHPSEDIASVTDHWCAQVYAAGAPKGCAVALDVEQYDVARAIAARWPTGFFDRTQAHGLEPALYCSASSIGAILGSEPRYDGRLWGAGWRGHEYTIPHCFAVQWDGGIGHAFDHSTVFDDHFTLWPNRGGQPIPAPPLPGGLVMPFVQLLPTKSGKGYWLIGADGGVESFGDAAFHGSMGGHHLNAPVVGAAEHPSGGGYWLVASDGGVFAFGAAKAHGSAAGLHLVSPIRAMASTPTGDGYWLFAGDGGVFTYGDAKFYGRPKQ